MGTTKQKRGLKIGITSGIAVAVAQIFAFIMQAILTLPALIVGTAIVALVSWALTYWKFYAVLQEKVTGNIGG